MVVLKEIVTLIGKRKKVFFFRWFLNYPEEGVIGDGIGDTISPFKLRFVGKFRRKKCSIHSRRDCGGGGGGGGRGGHIPC